MVIVWVNVGGLVVLSDHWLLGGQFVMVFRLRGVTAIRFYYIKDNYLQLYSSITFTQVSHFTWQHQWNLQLHRSFTTIFFVLYPRPQHSIAQPSRPVEVLLQTRFVVPIFKKTSSFTEY